MGIAVSVLWEGIVGEVADELEGFVFDFREVGSGGAELADVGEPEGGADVVEVKADGYGKAALSN